MHRILKSIIKFSTNDLMIVVDDIEIMIINQLKIYRINIEKEKMKRFNAFKAKIFQFLINRVTFHAM